MNSEKKANESISDAAVKRPDARDQLPIGNITWKALKKLDGITDEHRMILMSMVGSTIFSVGDPPTVPTTLPRKEISVELLVGARSASNQITVPIWRCDTVSSDGCLNPREDLLTTPSFKAMVVSKMDALTDKIANRQAHQDTAATLAFLNTTDLPIYKMLAVTTTINNTAMADALIGRYQDLIAAKYAEVYIQRAVVDLRAAISKFLTMADATQALQIAQIQPQLEEISQSAKQVLATAYTQTISTYSIAQEVQYMERALNANLSQTLKTSLAFGKSLR